MSVITVSDLKPNENELETLSPLQVCAVSGGGELSKEIGRYLGVLLGIASHFS
jgi:hypothetical protein